MNIIKQNRGMYLEEVINNSISYFLSKNIGYFEKRFVPFKVLKKHDATNFFGMLVSKSLVDYFGFYRNRHIEFEAKETSNEYFSVATIKEHQYQWLDKCENIGCSSYLIIYFSKHEKFFVIPFIEIRKQKRYSKIPFTYFEKKFDCLEIEFPGIINFIKKM